MATFPTVVVELEFAARIVEANFILDTGQLDSATTGHLSSGWADVSDRVRQLDIKRGRQHELDRVESGTLTLTLRNNDRALDPLYTGSPYYPNITPMRRVRVMVTWNSVTYQLFNGYIERWPVKRTAATDAEVTVDATDALALLEQADLDNVYGASLPGARLTQILDDAGWPAARRQLDNGTVMLDDALLEGSGQSALQHALDVGETELGTVFCDGDGDLVFFDRHHRDRLPYTISQGTFGNGPSDQFAYIDLAPSFDCDLLYNDIVLSIASDPLPATASDQASIDQYWRRTLPRTTLLADWDEANDMADELLRRYKTPDPRVDSMTLKPSGALWDQVLVRELGDRVTVVDRPAGPGAPTTFDCHIEGLQHSVSGFKWITTWQLTSSLTAGGVNSWTLNDATNGRLDYGQLVDY